MNKKFEDRTEPRELLMRIIFNVEISRSTVLSNNVNAACTVCVTIFSTGSKFLNFTELHTLTVARTYVRLLIPIAVVTKMSTLEKFHCMHATTCTCTTFMPF